MCKPDIIYEIHEFFLLCKTDHFYYLLDLELLKWLDLMCEAEVITFSSMMGNWKVAQQMLQEMKRHHVCLGRYGGHGNLLVFVR